MKPNGSTQNLDPQVWKHNGTKNSAGRASEAFTLLEVVLAILIAVGILVVALFFYQQAANLRTQLIQETERISVIRLLLDKITAELRAAIHTGSAAASFSGGSNFIQFVSTELPSRAAWSGAALGRSAAPETDLKLISYRLDVDEEINAFGLARSEEPFVSRRRVQTLGNIAFDVDATTNQPPPLLTDVVRSVYFRYWNGEAWQETWSSGELPLGVEVSLSAEPPPIEGDTNAFTGEIFRRVVYLPGSAFNSKNQPATNAIPSVAASPPETP